MAGIAQLTLLTCLELEVRGPLPVAEQLTRLRRLRRLSLCEYHERHGHPGLVLPAPAELPSLECFEFRAFNRAGYPQSVAQDAPMQVRGMPA